MSCAAAVLLAISMGTAFAEGPTLKLWPGRPPGETGDFGPEREEPPKEGQRKVLRLTGVTEPSITLLRPDRPNGAAVLIAPGGGYNILAWDLEGTEVAAWLNNLGITAVLLKYRVPRRDKESPHTAPLMDAQRAVRLVRQNAASWGIDPNRLGMLGFSAGGHLAILTGTHFDVQTYEPVDEADRLSARPDFLIPIYAAYLGDPQDPFRLNSLIRVSDQTPPMFLAVTYDDENRGAQAALLLAELKRKGVPAELHVFLRGGHGYGLRPSADPVSGWPRLCERWLRAAGWLEDDRKLPGL